MHPRTTIGMDEPMRAEEAGERLRAYIREVQELDAQVEEINSRKRELYAEAKSMGFHIKTLKHVARSASLDEANLDVAMLREYLNVMCGSKEAGSLLHKDEDFGALLWGSDNAWPSDYCDPRQGLKDTPAE
jgi:uncharacterized protein (UPF0335 family)